MDELRVTIAASIRRSLWTYWGDHVPGGDADLASLSIAGQAGYLDAADAIIAVLAPALTAAQREEIQSRINGWEREFRNGAELAYLDKRGFATLCALADTVAGTAIPGPHAEPGS